VLRQDGRVHISVTQAEAQTRADLLDVHSYAVDLDLTRGAEVFGSTTVVRFACTSPGAAAFVEVRPVNLRSAVLNGRPLDPASLAGGRLTLDGLEAENELRVEADMGYTTTGEGMHRFTDPADGEVYVYTQCGPDEGPRVFACFDQPDLKSVFEVSVTAPEGWTVLSNGPGEFRDGRWRFEPTQPISTYLAVVVGGPLHSVRAEHDGIPLGLHCRRSLAPHLDAEDILDITRRCFDRYHQLFDQRYPFGKYDQVFVPEFNWGAVENPGCVTFRDDFLFRSAVTDAEREIRAVVIAHEMAHMWFGDLVTMRWWDDLWLNESFAEYMGHQVIADATRFTGPWTGFASSRKPWGYDADQRGSTHPIAAQRIDDAASALVNFDGISYAKGAAALRQLVAWVGADAFFAGVNDHFARHAFGNAGLADLVDALTRASGRDVQGWTERWLRTSGVDMLRCSDAGIEHTGEPRRPHRIQVGAYDLSNGRLTLRERVEVDLDDSPTMPLPFERPDLLVLNDSDLTYAKVRLDERSWQSVTEALSTIDDELTRAVLWSTARDLVRDAELPPSDYLTLAEAHLPAEPAVAIVEAVLTFTLHLIDRYLPPDRRPAAATTLAGICRKIVYAEGVRLAAGRALIDSTQDLEELQESLRTATSGWSGGGPGAAVEDPAEVVRSRAHRRAGHRRRARTGHQRHGSAQCRPMPGGGSRPGREGAGLGTVVHRRRPVHPVADSNS